jgi:nitrite reductase/ring-hydroxylating ferredoxin subunit
MNARGLRRYIDDLLCGRRPRPFDADGFEAAQIRTAIELRAARTASGAPSEHFLTDLHRRLAARMPRGQETPDPLTGAHATRRQVVVAASAAALAGSAGIVAGAATGHVFPDGHSRADRPAMQPSDGSWQVVAASADVPAGVMHPFDVGSVVGFVRRVNGQPEAISGVCTHQGCRLWFDQPLDQLRCPCHSTSFSPTGQVLGHLLPIAPDPLPRLEVRELDGSIEVFVAEKTPTEPA